MRTFTHLGQKRPKRIKPASVNRVIRTNRSFHSSNHQEAFSSQTLTKSSTWDFISSSGRKSFSFRWIDPNGADWRVKTWSPGGAPVLVLVLVCKHSDFNPFSLVCDSSTRRRRWKKLRRQKKKTSVYASIHAIKRTFKTFIQTQTMSLIFISNQTKIRKVSFFASFICIRQTFPIRHDIFQLFLWSETKWKFESPDRCRAAGWRPPRPAGRRRTHEEENICEERERRPQKAENRQKQLNWTSNGRTFILGPWRNETSERKLF